MLHKLEYSGFKVTISSIIVRHVTHIKMDIILLSNSMVSISNMPPKTN